MWFGPAEATVGAWQRVMQTIVLTLLRIASHSAPYTAAQTEGDTAYDYQETYDEDHFYDESALSLGPTFDVPLVNVSVVVGQSALLPCSIDYLGKHKVAWLDFNSFPLTYEERRVIDDPRFSVIRSVVKDWTLQIRDVRREDEGAYRCTINTNPVRNKLINLHVNVPPIVDDAMSTSDVTTQEGETVELICVVHGVPTPEITWYRRQADILRRCRFPLTNGAPGVIGSGSHLIIPNISRHCDGVYECLAENGVPNSVRRQILVTIEFRPVIVMPNRRLGQQIGRRETILNCLITAFPQASNYWEKDGRRLASSLKHRIEAYEEGDSTLTLSLRIHDLGRADYGEYRCVAANSLGRDEQVMQLFDSTRELESIHTTSPAQLQKM